MMSHLPRCVKLNERNALLNGMVKVVASNQQNASFFGNTALVGRLDFVHFFRFAGGRLLNVRLQVVQRSSTGVLVDAFTVDDPQQRWVTFHLEIDTDGSVLSAVDLRDRNGRVVLKSDGQLIPSGSQTLWGFDY